MRRVVLCGAFVLSACGGGHDPWVEVDRFEAGPGLSGWTNVDLQNETDPYVPDAQVSERRREPSGNHYMLRKPAPDGVVGNRKAVGYRALPVPIAPGETATLYVRVQVEAFPNNHSFGLSDLSAEGIEREGYDAFEPMIRITDKTESDGTKNNGTLMVLSGEDKAYARIRNPATGETAAPMRPGVWYELWVVVDNASRAEGGQRYDLYVRGGEFARQTLVFDGADFRMRREAPLRRLMAISNTGPARAPYGNGGVRYDDVFVAPGRVLSEPRSVGQ